MKKFLVFMLFVFPLTAISQDCTNFEGYYKGECNVVGLGISDSEVAFIGQYASDMSSYGGKPGKYCYSIILDRIRIKNGDLKMRSFNRKQFFPKQEISREVSSYNYISSSNEISNHTESSDWSKALDEFYISIQNKDFTKVTTIKFNTSGELTINSATIVTNTSPLVVIEADKECTYKKITKRDFESMTFIH